MLEEGRERQASFQATGTAIQCGPHLCRGLKSASQLAECTGLSAYRRHVQASPAHRPKAPLPCPQPLSLRGLMQSLVFCLPRVSAFQDPHSSPMWLPPSWAPPSQAHESLAAASALQASAPRTAPRSCRRPSTNRWWIAASATGLHGCTRPAPPSLLLSSPRCCRATAPSPTSNCGRWSASAPWMGTFSPVVTLSVIMHGRLHEPLAGISTARALEAN